MRNYITLSSILLLLALGTSCSKNEEKKAESPAEAVKPEAVKPEAVKPEAVKPEAVASAVATVASASGSKVEGSVTFTASGEAVKVEGKLTGLTPGEHGFHVHEKGDCSSPDAKSAGGHFNPASVDHGAPGSDAHHTGDLGNITANAEGVAEISIEVPMAHLSLAADAANNIVGRAVVVHGGADDLKSQPSGAAGPRVGCGVIASK